jgi:GT2 family glycosyltransferase
MRPITFCIPTANNERDYIHLLLKSIRENTNIDMHEILVFIDSDNQNTFESLVDIKDSFPDLKIHRNTTGFPIGPQRNPSIMFNAAKNDIVCYLQSDMVVGRNFDKHIIDSMIDETVVLACTRIEPPLHPASPEKIVMDFGVTPDVFEYDKFQSFVSELQSENRGNTSGYFAPFAMYKKTYFDVLGGFDTQFRCSREDSDFIIRIEQNSLTSIQSWKACVYHFTCVSSRGNNWYKQNDADVTYKNVLQHHADIEELKRFIRKWGFFGHNPMPVYNIGLYIEMDRFADIQLLEYVEPYFTDICINDKAVARQLRETVRFKSDYYANLRWGYSTEHWESTRHLFSPVDFDERIQYKESYDALENDVVFSIKYSDLATALQQKDGQLKLLIENSHLMVTEHATGKYVFEGMTIRIYRKNDMSSSYKRVNNIDTILNEGVFVFL